MQERQECQYGENCTFAYCQEEIDVWTQERKGALSRELLFDPLGSTERRALSVTRLLQLHMGMFMFLCEVRLPSPGSPAASFTCFGIGSIEVWNLCFSIHRNVLTVNLALSANAAKRTWPFVQTSQLDTRLTTTSESLEHTNISLPLFGVSSVG